MKVRPAATRSRPECAASARMPRLPVATPITILNAVSPTAASSERSAADCFSRTKSVTRVSGYHCQCPSHQFARLVLNSLEVFGAGETFGIDLVNVFGAGRPRREPAAPRHHFEAADWGPVPRGACEHGFDGVAGQLARRHLFRVQFRQRDFLRGRGL